MADSLIHSNSKTSYYLRKEQCRRLNALMSYLKSSMYFKNYIELCEMTGINRSHLSSVLNGKHDAMPTARKVCDYFKLPFIDWIETGMGDSPSVSFQNTVKYIGTVNETDNLKEKLEQPSNLIVMPENLYCDAAFIFRGRMYFVNRHDDMKSIRNGSMYFIEDNDGNKYIKRVYEKYNMETRILELDDLDSSIRTIDLQYNKTSVVLNIIAVLDFTR